MSSRVIRLRDDTHKKLIEIASDLGLSIRETIDYLLEHYCPARPEEKV